MHVIGCPGFNRNHYAAGIFFFEFLDIKLAYGLSHVGNSIYYYHLVPLFPSFSLVFRLEVSLSFQRCRACEIAP